VGVQPLLPLLLLLLLELVVLLTFIISILWCSRQGVVRVLLVLTAPSRMA
jgi:hypothetical protein